MTKKGTKMDKTFISLLDSYLKSVEKNKLKRIAYDTAVKTKANNNQCEQFLNMYNTEKQKALIRLCEILTIKPDYTGMRHIAITLAKKIELEAIAYGAPGLTFNWLCKKQPTVIQGHHINNVRDHLYDQANPDNIIFCSREEHLNKHSGDYRNGTSGNLIDKSKKLRSINAKRNFVNELKSAGYISLQGVLHSFTDNASKKADFKTTAKLVAKSAGKSVIDYLFERLLQD